MPSIVVARTAGARTWLRFSGALAVVTAVMGLSYGCCSAAECAGRVELHLVDADGQKAAARLRHRSNQSSNSVYYDCTDGTASTSLPAFPRGTCQDGVAFLEQPYFDRAELKYEISFLLPDGHWTDLGWNLSLDRYLEWRGLTLFKRAVAASARSLGAGRCILITGS